MPKATFLGHPAHPMLIVAPAALLPFGFVMDLLFRRSGRRSYRDAARYALVGAAAGGTAAAATGAMDYAELTPGSDEMKTATVHAALNVGMLAATLANLALRARGADARAPLPFALSAFAAAGVLVSGWYGGHLVYHHGLRVEGRDPIAAADELAPPADAQIAQELAEVAELVPSVVPSLAQDDDRDATRH